MVQNKIEMVFECTVESAVKSLGAMADGAHVCTGLFDGSLCMWDVKVSLRMSWGKETRGIGEGRCYFDGTLCMWDVKVSLSDGGGRKTRDRERGEDHGEP
jgi:hypothetical protein